MSARLASIVFSVAAHATIYSAVYGHGGAGRKPTSQAQLELARDEIAIETLPAEAPHTNEAEEAPAVRASSAQHSTSAHHRHDYPVPSSHASEPHDPKIAHGGGGAAQHGANVDEPSADAPTGERMAPSSSSSSSSQADLPVFTLRPARGGKEVGPAGGTVSVSAGGGEAGQVGQVYAEAAVGIRAQLLSSAIAVYPPEARNAELEADVLLEIVVGREGFVEAARVTRISGALDDGFNEAALRAVKRYRFTPAQVGGSPVRVRMPWTLRFRLR